MGLWLLWLLVVEIPVLGRTLSLAMPKVARSRPILAALVGLTTGLLVWIWTVAAPVLIRPVFTWSANGAPQLASIVPLQQDGLVFAVVAGGAALVGALLRGPRGLMDPVVASKAPARDPGRARTWIRRVVIAGLLTLGLGGVITSPLDAVILFAALACAAPLARTVADRTVIGTIIHKVPPLGRYLAGGAIVLIVSITLMPALVAMGGPSEFFPLIVVIVLGIFVMEVATTASSRSGHLPSRAATTIGLSMLLLLTTLLLPAIVLADNCSGLGDCFPQVFAAALAAAAVPTLLAAASRSSSPPNEETPPPPPDYPPDWQETPPPPPVK